MTPARLAFAQRFGSAFSSALPGPVDCAGRKFGLASVVPRAGPSANEQKTARRACDARHADQGPAIERSNAACTPHQRLRELQDQRPDEHGITASSAAVCLPHRSGNTEPARAERRQIAMSPTCAFDQKPKQKQKTMSSLSGWNSAHQSKSRAKLSRTPEAASPPRLRAHLADVFSSRR